MGPKAIFIFLTTLFFIVGVAFGTAKKQNEHETDILASVNSKAVASFCAAAPYKDVCERSIAVVAKNLTASDKDYIMAVIDSTLDEIKNAMAVVDGIKIDPKQDPYHYMTVGDCKELLDEAIDELQACVSLLDNTDLHSLEVHHIHELLNWLSTVHSYESSCLDDIENPEYRTIIENGMANASHLTHNAVNMFADIPLVLKNLDQVLGGNNIIPLRSRRLLHDLGKDGYPTWIPVADRKLLSEPVKPEGKNVLKPNATVAKDGSGQFKTISEAVAAYPQNITGRYFIYVKEGVYQENVVIDKKKPNIFIYGDGPGKTVLTGDKNYGIMKIPTKDTATLIAIGHGFIARDMTIRNTAGPDGHQAVALRIQSDMASIYNCSIEGYQDTLYYHAHRQFFRNCVISGTVDFIFGRGAALIQNSEIIVRKGNPSQFNAVTADGKELEKDRTGLVLQNCRIVADSELYPTRFETRTYLGRPWKKYAKTVIMESEIGDFIRPEGYTKFETQNKEEVNEPTCQYFEYKNRGPGAKTDKRDFKQFTSSRVIDLFEAAEYTANTFLDANVWLHQTGTPHVLGFTRS